MAHLEPHGVTRYEMVRMLVLNEIADDYEEPSHIYERLEDLGRKCGMVIQPLDVKRALVDLVESGWAGAYDLWRKPVEELRAPPPPERVDEYYYLITQRGREAQSSFEAWPFDDTGAILQGWSPPTD